MWHPHLKRKWIDDNNYMIIDNRKKVYQTSLLQIQSSNFLDVTSQRAPKMSCGCRFIKQVDIEPIEQAGNSESDNIQHTSLIEINKKIEPKSFAQIEYSIIYI